MSALWIMHSGYRSMAEDKSRRPREGGDFDYYLQGHSLHWYSSERSLLEGYLLLNGFERIEERGGIYQETPEFLIENAVANWTSVNQSRVQFSNKKSLCAATLVSLLGFAGIFIGFSSFAASECIKSFISLAPIIFFVSAFFTPLFLLKFTYDLASYLENKRLAPLGNFIPYDRHQDPRVRGGLEARGLNLNSRLHTDSTLAQVFQPAHGAAAGVTRARATQPSGLGVTEQTPLLGLDRV